MRKTRPKVDHPYVFSVSQVETFRLCPRKWAFLKIDGLRDEGSAASILGGNVHDVLEKYLEEGIPFDASTEIGAIAMSGVEHLPLPKTPGMTVEEWFTVKIGDAVFQGLKDFENLTLAVPLVGDHKTTKNFMWAKTSKTLRSNVQAGIYAYDAYLKTNSEEIDLLWNYYRTAGSRASLPIRARIKLPEIMEVVEGVAETASKMIETKKNCGRALDVVQDIDGCDAFGGCPFKKQCGLTAKTRFKAMFRQKEKEEDMANSVLENLKARKAKKGKTPLTVVETAAAPVNPPENAVAPETVPETDPPEVVDGMHLPEKDGESVVAPPEKKKARKPRPKKASDDEAKETVSAGEVGSTHFGAALSQLYPALLADIAEAVKKTLDK